MGAYLTGSAVGTALDGPSYQRERKRGRVFSARLFFALLCSLGLFKLMPGHLSVLTLDACDDPRSGFLASQQCSEIG